MIKHNQPTIGNDEYASLSEVIESGFLVSGKQVALFENEFAKYLGLPGGHAVAVSSGTAALFVSLHTLEAEGKEVGIPAYTCSSLRHAATLANAKVRYYDSAKYSPNIDISRVAENKSDIVIAPHMFGHPIDIEKIKGPSVIEDCAQSLGSELNGKMLGTLGKIGVFSFYATKIITSGGQGGMVVSRDKKIIDIIRDYIDFDCKSDNKNRFNFQMTELQAACGRTQLKKLPDFIKRRREICNLYTEAGLDIVKPSSGRENCFRVILKIHDPIKAIKRLQEQSISAIVPIGREYLDSIPGSYPNAQNFSKRTLSLPIHPSLYDAEIEKIVSIIKKI